MPRASIPVRCRKRPRKPHSLLFRFLVQKRRVRAPLFYWAAEARINRIGLSASRLLHRPLGPPTRSRRIALGVPFRGGNRASFARLEPPFTSICLTRCLYSQLQFP